MDTLLRYFDCCIFGGVPNFNLASKTHLTDNVAYFAPAWLLRSLNYLKQLKSCFNKKDGQLF